MTLARLQQFTTLGSIALAAAWAFVAWHAGHAVAAFGGALLIVFGYAFVLALEFALLRHAHGSDPAPRAGFAQLAGAWWGEVLSAPRVFCWRQPFRSARWPDHLPPEASGRRGLLLVHGFVCNRGIWNPWMARLHAEGVPFVAINLEPVFGSIDGYVAAVEVGVRRLEAATGLAPVVAAHSMGGLAVRRWWAEQDVSRLHRLVTIATPHHGTWLARYALSANTRQMHRGSRWLQTLAEREGGRAAARTTCFYGHCDNIVFPPSTAALEGADNRHLPGVAHVHMAGRPEPWAEVRRWLGA